jgi:hypothetical protein
MPGWTYAELRDALAPHAALSDDAAAAALSAETITAEPRDVPTAFVRGVLLATGEWGGLVLVSRSVPSETRPVALIAACITVVDTLTLTETLELTRAENWAAIQAQCAALVAAGLCSQSSSDLILGQRQPTIPRLEPAPTGQDVAAARLLGT